MGILLCGECGYYTSYSIVLCKDSSVIFIYKGSNDWPLSQETRRVIMSECDKYESHSHNDDISLR